MIFTNTFNYPVDLPKGTHSVRRILNLCCAANPTKSFYIRLNSKRGFHVIRASNLTTDRQAVPRGALCLWQLGIGKPRGDEPQDAEIRAALAHHDPAIRHVARNYLQAVAWSVPLDQWVTKTEDSEIALWTAIGITSMMVRIEKGATHVATIDRLKREIGNEASFSGLSPELAVLTAFELARLANEPTGLDLVAKRDLSEHDFSGIRADLLRMVRSSGYLREKLATMDFGWLGFTPEVLEGLGYRTTPPTAPGGDEKRPVRSEPDEQDTVVAERKPVILPEPEEGAATGQEVETTAAADDPEASEPHRGLWLLWLAVAVGVVGIGAALLLRVYRRQQQ